MTSNKLSDSETVLVAETGLGKFQVEARMGDAALLIDEPKEIGGLGSGPNPYDLIAAAVGACTTAGLGCRPRTGSSWPSPWKGIWTRPSGPGCWKSPSAARCI